MVVGQQRKNGIKVVFANAQSIISKINEVRAVMPSINPDIFAVTESWANEDIGNDLLIINGYELVSRVDRNDTDRGRGGGILVYAKKELDVLAEDVMTDFNQCTGIKIKRRCGDVNLYVVYRSPNSTKANDDDLVKWVKEMRGPTIIIGDFNFPDIDWSAGIAGSRGRNFLDATQETFMEQLVNEPTHRSGNILDLVLCNEEEMVTEVKAEGRLGKSDHDILSFQMCVENNEKKEQWAAVDFARANFAVMREDAQKINWNEELQGKDVDGM